MAASETNRLLEPGTYRVHAGSADYDLSGNATVTVQVPTARGAIEAQGLSTIADKQALSATDCARLVAVGIDLLSSTLEPENRAPIGATTAYVLPPAFYADHRARALPEIGFSAIERESKRAVTVRMDGAAYADLVGDCEYYSDSGMAADMQACNPGIVGLISSARATLKRLRSVGAPIEAPAIEQAPAVDTAPANAAPVVSDSDMGAYSVSRLHSGSEDGYLWYVVTAEDDNPVDGTGHVSEESARYDASIYAAREDSYVEAIESATPANPAACEAGGIEESVRVEWFDTVVGAWFDMGEALSLDAARERIAGYCATDARERMGARYRIVCEHIEEYRAIEAR